MSEEIGFITNALQRIEAKIDTGLMNHENRISRVEGGLHGIRWFLGTFISIAALAAAFIFA
jgi:hypothetical protein